MTLSTLSASQLVLGDGLTTNFSFNFVADSASDITVTSISSSGTQTILSSTQYVLLLNPPTSNQLWGIGGNLTYPLDGSAIDTSVNLLIQRTVPLTQETSVQNQGNYAARVTEQALDILCMEIQQVAARTGQMRGTWATGVAYNFGDVIVDGANGNNTGNYYMCAIANTSGTWTTDLSAGDWSLVINIENINAVVGAYLPLIGGTISGNLTVAGTLSPDGGVAASTVAGTALISGGVTNSKFAQMAARTVKGNSGSAIGNASDITLGAGLSLSSGALNTAAPNFSQKAVATPGSTSNRTGVMMGLAGSITPNNSGVVYATLSGNIYNTTANDGSSIVLRYGTGTAPTNGAALTGATIGSIQSSTQPSGGGAFLSPVCIPSLVSGLALGTAVWFDASLAAVSAGTAGLSSAIISIYELK